MRLPKFFKAKRLLHIEISSFKNPWRRYFYHQFGASAILKKQQEQEQDSMWLVLQLDLCVMIIDAMMLSESTSNYTSFMFVNKSIYMFFKLANPFTTEKINTKRPWNHDPSVCFVKCINFSFHG